MLDLSDSILYLLVLFYDYYLFLTTEYRFYWMNNSSYIESRTVLIPTFAENLKNSKMYYSQVVKPVRLWIKIILFNCPYSLILNSNQAVCSLPSHGNMEMKLHFLWAPMSFQGRKEVEDAGKQIINNNLQGVCTVFRRLPTGAVSQCRFSGREGTDSTTFSKMSGY